MQYLPWILQSGFVEQWMLTVQTTGRYPTKVIPIYGESLCISLQPHTKWYVDTDHVKTKRGGFMVTWLFMHACPCSICHPTIQRLPQPCIGHASLLQCNFYFMIFFPACVLPSHTQFLVYLAPSWKPEWPLIPSTAHVVQMARGKECGWINNLHHSAVLMTWCKASRYTTGCLTL